MTTTERISAGTKRMLEKRPPWPVRTIGMVIVVVSVGWWIKEPTPTAWLPLLIELTKHGTIALIGMTFAYPEGALRLMNFARQFPLLDRRSVRRR